MRLLLFSGKGGVGKTSIAAATALRSAALGHRTLVLSADAAHSLGDVLDQRLTAEPSPVGAGLWAEEIDAEHETAANWGVVESWLRELLARQGLDPVMAAEMARLPGMNELTALLAIAQHAESGRFDLIVVDCAPTAETVRLLTLPELMRWWVDRAVPLERVAARLARPLLRRLVSLDLPAPDDAAIAGMRELYERLGRVRVLLCNPDVTSARLVLTPERVVLSESRRTYTALTLFDYPVDLVVCNQVIPPEVSDPHFSAWQEAQARVRAEIDASFAPLPVLTAPLLEREPVGRELLTRLGARVYGEHDPATIFHRGRPTSVTAVDGGYVLSLPMPAGRRDELSLTQTGDELTIRAGALRRTIVLPRVLAGCDPAGAALEDGVLTVRFAHSTQRGPAPA